MLDRDLQMKTFVAQQAAQELANRLLLAAYEQNDGLRAKHMKTAMDNFAIVAEIMSPAEIPE